MISILILFYFDRIRHVCVFAFTQNDKMSSTQAGKMVNLHTHNPSMFECYYLCLSAKMQF